MLNLNQLKYLIYHKQIQSYKRNIVLTHEKITKNGLEAK